MKKMIFPLITSAILMVAAPKTLPAQDVSAQISNLQQQMAAIRNGAIQSNSSAAQAIAKMQELQADLEALKAAIEANSHLIQTQTDNSNLKLNDMEARIASFEERLNIQGKQVTSAVSTVAPEAAAEAEMYQIALNQINNSEFLKAIATFKKFMNKFPDSEYNANAQYWIGECYFAMRDYEQSIKQLQYLIEKYRNSDKIPAAFLKQGYAFIELGMESDAMTFLNNLIRKYPRSKEAKEAKDRIERMKNLKTTTTSTAPGNPIPLAPGVEVPDKEKLNAHDKYK